MRPALDSVSNGAVNAPIVSPAAARRRPPGDTPRAARQQTGPVSHQTLGHDRAVDNRAHPQTLTGWLLAGTAATLPGRTRCAPRLDLSPADRGPGLRARWSTAPRRLLPGRAYGPCVIAPRCAHARVSARVWLARMRRLSWDLVPEGGRGQTARWRADLLCRSATRDPTHGGPFGAGRVVPRQSPSTAHANKMVAVCPGPPRAVDLGHRRGLGEQRGARSRPEPEDSVRPDRPTGASPGSAVRG